MQPINVVCPHCFARNRVPETRLEDSPHCGKCHEPLFTGEPVPVSDATGFSRMIASNDIPVVVDFWAPWCAPCKTFAPVFAQAARSLEPGIRFVKVDTESNREVASRYRIQSIPTLAIFKNGAEMTRRAGAMPLATLREWLESSIGTIV